MGDAGRWLWGGTDLGEWTNRSPTHLYALFLRHQRPGGLAGGRHARRRTEAYAKLLMHLVAMQFNRHKWRRRLPQAGLVPEDVAQQAVMHLLRKSATMRMQHAGYKPLLGVLNVAIRMYVLQCVEGRRRKKCHEVNASDYYGRPRLGGSDGRQVGGLDGTPAGRATAAARDSADREVDEHLRAIREALTSEDAADAVLGDVPTATAAQADALESAFGIMRDGLLTGRGVPTRAQLPKSLQSEVGHAAFGLVCARLRRLARRLAAGE